MTDDYREVSRWPPLRPSELAKRIGVIEPCLVTPLEDDGCRIVACRRRRAAAVEGGVADVPCGGGCIRAMTEAQFGNYGGVPVPYELDDYELGP